MLIISPNYLKYSSKSSILISGVKDFTIILLSNF